MANETTMLSDLIVPQVMADMISAKLPTKLMFKPLAAIDNTLVGVPGDKITVPRYAYIGDAAEVAEGVKMGTAKLQTSTTQFTIKKIGKAVEITDESVLSGYGNPAAEAQKQILMAIASKIDADCADALQTSKLVYDGTAGIINYDGVVEATDLFTEEEQSKKIMFIHSKQLTQIRKDKDFLDKNKYNMDLMMTGAIGTIAGCEVVVSNRVKLASGIYYNPIVKQTQTTETEDEAAALTIYMKRSVLVESTRDALASKTTPSATEHYGVALTNESKVVIAKFKATPAASDTGA
ncbi:N4-gp56 family major capsid protein [Erysipelotrichaceae bacterium AF19-24AC]|nr:N4-gp56 family major capsid protein [Erysipelotrichaceae bacterium AF19-24AC]